MSERMISPGFVEDALACLRQRGIDPAPLLSHAGIEKQPGKPVSRLQYARLWLAIARRIGDEFFELAARPMRPGSYALMGYAVLHAATLEQALLRALRFLDVVLDDPRGKLQKRDGLAEIVLSGEVGPHRAFAYRTFWLLLLGLMCWLIGRRIVLSGVDFACPAPCDRREYHQFFGTPVRFDQPRGRLSFPAHYLSLPTIRDERELRVFLRHSPANILFGYRPDKGLAMPIRSHLRATAPNEWPDFDAIAAHLGLSVATLRRRLRSEGQSYSSIRDELRQTLAQELLKEERSTVSEIALKLGYAEPSAFHRAFSKWTGMTPAAFRNAEPLAAAVGGEWPLANPPLAASGPERRRPGRR